MTSNTQGNDGRDIRWTDIHPGSTEQFENAIEDIYNDRLDAIVLRQAFPVDATADALRTINDDVELPWLRPNRTGPAADVRILGLAATPSFATPGGPPVDVYFDNVEQYENVTDKLFDANFDLSLHVEQMLGRVAGNRPVERLVNSDGRAFAAFTVRLLPEGQCIILHNDHGHVDLPMYADVVSNLDTSITLSFFAVLQAPEQGGKLILHGVTDSDPVPQLAGGFPDAAAIQSRYKFEAFKLDSRDAIIFAAGKFFHQVEPVKGPRPRITLGAFLALSRNRQKVYYWN